MWLGRLGENDKHWGNWTVSKSSKRLDGKKPEFFIYANIESNTRESGVEELPLGQVTRTSITFHWSAFGSIRYVLPWVLVKPRLTKVVPKSWTEKDIERLGRNWYYNVSERRYGFNMTRTGIQISLGSTPFSNMGKTYLFDYPWTIDHYETISYNADTGMPSLFIPKFTSVRGTVTCANYLIQDYDGEYLVVSCFKQEARYYRCKGILKPFRYLLPKKSYWRSDFWFSKETGAEKGSWKGGTIGSSIPSNKNEAIEDSLKRYCEERKINVIGFIGYSVGTVTKDMATEMVLRHYPQYINLLNPKPIEV